MRPSVERTRVAISFGCKHGRWWRPRELMYGTLLSDDTYTCEKCGEVYHMRDNEPPRCTHGFHPGFCLRCRATSP